MAQFPMRIAFFFSAIVSCSELNPLAATPSLPPDAEALLAFKSTADVNGKLPFSRDTRSDYCRWQGVRCLQGRLVRFSLSGLSLGGSLGNSTLTSLSELRVLTLQNLSLTGPIPDLSAFPNLKVLFLDHNTFSGGFPRSVASLHRLQALDMSFNSLSGHIPSQIISLDKLSTLRLEQNKFSGMIPPLNQSSLQSFNISGNNLTGAIPVTPPFVRFGPSAFSMNPGLCGEIIKKECDPRQPFFDSSTPPSPAPVARRGEELRVSGSSDTVRRRHRGRALIIGKLLGGLVLFSLLAFVVVFVLLTMKRRRPKPTRQTSFVRENVVVDDEVKKVQAFRTAKSGNLVFCAGEVQDYSLDQLMRASAELLGRGTIGTTYKAVLDNQFVVAVKRLDAGKIGGVNRETFEEHMDSVGRLRHTNLVPLRAYFQAKDERLLVYDYQHNGSLFALLHGSRSVRAKPLHWTSCLKIAEDVAQGLAYIHQAWRLIHGNLKSSNVLLGADFEACVADYCLTILTGTGDDQDPSGYGAPETRNSGSQSTTRSDVFSFGVLLVELLTGELPSRHPPATDEISRWVRSVRSSDSREDGKVNMLLEVAAACRSPSPEQRPSMWQVLKTLQQIKEVLLLEESESGMSSS